DVEAARLVRAVLERGTLVASGDEPPRADAAPTVVAYSPAGGISPALPVLEAGIGCPISAGDEPLGVIALFGRRPSIADRDYQHFIQAVANVLGGAILRHRTRRRIELELDVGRVLA